MGLVPKPLVDFGTVLNQQLLGLATGCGKMLATPASPLNACSLLMSLFAKGQPAVTQHQLKILTVQLSITLLGNVPWPMAAEET